MTVTDTTRESTDPAGALLPLSFHQEFLCMFDNGREEGPFGPKYHIVGAWRIEGELDTATLQAALDDVVERHEALRTEIVRNGDSHAQRILPPTSPRLDVRDLTDTAPEDRDRRADELLNDVEDGRLSIRRLPLLRAVLGRFDDRDAVLALIAHHTAADAWAMHVIMRDLAACYAARRDGTSPDLPEASQYREYAQWEREASLSPGAERRRAYWRRKLSGAAILALPTDEPRSANLPKTTAWLRFALDADLAEAVPALARESRGSAFMTLLAAYKVFLHRQTGATDITIPTFSSGRGQERFQDTVGSFINFLPLRTDIAGCGTFREVIRRVRTTCAEAYTHEIPFSELMREAPGLMAAAATDDHQITAFQAVHAPFDTADREAGGIRYTKAWKRLLSQSDGSDVPDGILWSLHIDPSGEMVGSLGFNTNRYREETMRRQLDDFIGLLRELVAAPDAPLETRSSSVVEEKVREMWTAVLGASDTPGATFFELGGQSISAVRLVGRIEQELGVWVDVDVLFDDPDLETFTKAVLAAAAEPTA
ncbi:MULTISPECIES: condensation domain-containing protein [Streptomyces]|uniref:Condensation domain-containing protein n=1 Tax=Streptomyces desertarenae TaxID=2666184 RepID=A0ABW4PQZ3_9ACTN